MSVQQFTNEGNILHLTLKESPTGDIHNVMCIFSRTLSLNVISILSLFIIKHEVLLSINTFKFNYYWSHSINNLVIIFRQEQVRNISCVEEVVNIFQECLLHNLRICEDETDTLPIYACREHQFFQEVSKLFRTKVFGNFHLFASISKHVASKLGQTLFARSSYSNEHHVSSRLSEHSGHSHYMLYCVIKEDQVHLAHCSHVVIIQEVYEGVF